MIDKIKKMIPFIIISAFFVFWIFSIVFKIKSMDDIRSYIGYSSSIVSILVGMYIFFLWRYNPIEKTPRLKKYYRGEIQSNYKKAPNGGKKEIFVKISQTLFSVRIWIKTDINCSVSLIGSIVEENEQYVLYYTYITNPNINTIKKNPIQYGSCRMVVDNSHKFSGFYWTNMETSGQITFKECKRAEYKYEVELL